ncbi:acyl carrier protein [Hoeflea sp. TYP-13]|uniref:acyl carrier protein n=1 Tax=Hoeflea sp. TYP-13 TaxID=3230023 RepID=UPI0034C62187
MIREDNVVSVQKMVAEILQVPAEQISCDVPVRSLRGWDHIVHMTLVLMIQDMIGHNLTVEELGRSLTVRDFATLLDNRGR